MCLYLAYDSYEKQTIFEFKYFEYLSSAGPSTTTLDPRPLATISKPGATADAAGT